MDLGVVAFHLLLLCIEFRVESLLFLAFLADFGCTLFYLIPQLAEVLDPHCKDIIKRAEVIAVVGLKIIKEAFKLLDGHVVIRTGFGYVLFHPLNGGLPFNFV